MGDCICKDKEGKKTCVCDEPVHLDAYALRGIAEAASGMRGSNGEPYFVIQEGEPGEGKLLVRPADPDETPPPGTIMVINTPPQVQDRPVVTEGSITPKGGKPFPISQYDAVFWTEAAVEKFVFPYYVSKSMWKAKNHLARLSDTWFHKGPKSRSECEDESEQGIPFAIGHVPDSDFVPLAEMDGSDVEILFMCPSDGSVYAKSLAQMLQEQEARGHGTTGP